MTKVRGSWRSEKAWGCGTGLAIAVGVLAGLLLLGPVRAGAEAAGRAPEGTRAVEQRVQEMEQKFRDARDEALRQCQKLWSQCLNSRCKRIPPAQAKQWQACQEGCDGGYDGCRQRAYELWPEGQ